MSVLQSSIALEHWPDTLK